MWNQSDFSQEVFLHPDIIQHIEVFDTTDAVAMLRLDLIQAWASGNKYFKLLKPLSHALVQHPSCIVSKGGMFSNHLVALAEACHHFHLPLISIVRSHAPDDSNPSIIHQRQLGAKIIWLQPAEYKQYDQVRAVQDYPGCHFIPEGGLSPDGIAGVQELGRYIAALAYTDVVVSGGSLCTAIGIAASLTSETKLHIVPAWKGCTTGYVQDLLQQYHIQPHTDWEVWEDHHLGGFGRWNQDLYSVMDQFTADTGIPLDPVYTGKLVLAFAKQLEIRSVSAHRSWLLIHTGGLQGVEGFAYRYGEPWKSYAEKIHALQERGNQ